MMPTLGKLDGALGPFLNDGARIMFLMFAAISSIIFLAYQSSAVRYRYSLDYGEAPLVDQAMRLASGQNIYRADISQPPYTISNYPPLYVTLLSISVKLFGLVSTFFVGRMISVLCALISSFCLARIVYVSTSDRFAAWIAGLTFLAFPFVVFWSSLLRIDMLALALSLGGLCMLVAVPISTHNFIAASLLLVAAIYTRQSYALAAPLAAFVWLWTRDRRQAIPLALFVGGLSLVLFLILNRLTHGGFFFNIVIANVNEFKMDQLEYHGDRLRTAALILICFGIVSLFLIRRWNPLWTLSAPYLIGASLSALTIGKIGSNVNYLLELCAALSLAAGVVVAWSRAHLSVQALRAALLITLALGVGKMMHAMLSDYVWDLHERRAATKDLRQLEAFVAETPGLILADEYMGMLTLQGRPLVIQPFEVTQLARAGKWDQTPLLESIKKKEFASIILYDRPWSNERWTPEMVAAISQSYILVDIVADNKIYKAFERTPTQSIDACPAVTWRLPSDGSLGVQLSEGGIDFFGRGNEGRIPVYAVADGLLTRGPEWVDAVAILYNDPLRPREKIWAFYGGMAAANGVDSFVSEDFPPGITDIPVKSGQLLGYQGTWNGTPQWPKWVHVFIALVDAHGKSSQPKNITSDDLLDPAPYLGIKIESGNKNLQRLKCEQP